VEESKEKQGRKGKGGGKRVRISDRGGDGENKEKN